MRQRAGRQQARRKTAETLETPEHGPGYVPMKCVCRRRTWRRRFELPCSWYIINSSKTGRVRVLCSTIFDRDSSFVASRTPSSFRKRRDLVDLNSACAPAAEHFLARVLYLQMRWVASSSAPLSSSTSSCPTSRNSTSTCVIVAVNEAHLCVLSDSMRLCGLKRRALKAVGRVLTSFAMLHVFEYGGDFL